uniref:Uncharacterized protein n=1 Tax=Rhizophora mucronata TaxID=61149 RepID=A0A2P2PY31_RHIMU
MSNTSSMIFVALGSSK